MPCFGGMRLSSTTACTRSSLLGSKSCRAERSHQAVRVLWVHAWFLCAQLVKVLRFRDVHECCEPRRGPEACADMHPQCTAHHDHHCCPRQLHYYQPTTSRRSTGTTNGTCRLSVCTHGAWPKAEGEPRSTGTTAFANAWPPSSLRGRKAEVVAPSLWNHASSHYDQPLFCNGSKDPKRNHHNRHPHPHRWARNAPQRVTRSGLSLLVQSTPFHPLRIHQPSIQPPFQLPAAKSTHWPAA